MEPNPFTELSEREMKVLNTIVEDLSNVRIAERQVVSEKTAKGQVSNIPGKLHLAS